MDRDELKATFHRVNAYRHVCEAVRRSANHTLFSGVFFAVIAVLYFNMFGPSHAIFLIVAALAAVEIGVGIWKKLRPSVECVLVDALCNLAFGGSVLARQAIAWQNGAGIVSPISLFIGAWALYDAWNNFAAYRQLRQAFEVRPTATQMRYVADMARDIQAADPANDPAALDLPSDPPIQALLTDDLAFIVDAGSGEAVAIDGEEFHLTRQALPEGKPVGVLFINGQRLPPFPLSEPNWLNYCRWKGQPATP